MANKFYITTPLYYVNASPHIGHSYTNIAADCLARYMRSLLGKENVWFLTGTDEYGQKIQKAADEAKLTPQEFADKMVAQFVSLWRDLDISYDDFIRTTEDRHTGCVQRILEILHQKGDIYQDTYEGWYCTPCETFWMGSQLINQACPDCQRPVEKIAEKNFFFTLSKYQDWLLGHIQSHPEFIRPQIRRNEILSFLRLNKLNDLCISRPRERLSWGIPLPFSPAHVTYVWFDALINYISAVGKFDTEGRYQSLWWPADLQLIGKDILRQHAVYWPIILHALDIEPPRTIFAHGWWLINEGKMSKSKGNAVSPVDMVHKYGIDVYRYFLLRDVPFGLDGNFSEDAIIKRFNADLANDLGNLLYRTLTMIEKYFEGKIPQKITRPKAQQANLINTKLERLDCGIRDNLKASGDFNFSAALEAIWEVVNLANKYVEDTKPWNLAKEKKSEELEDFILVLVNVIRGVERAVSSFMPQAAESLRNQIGKDTINKGKPLFPRIENLTPNT